MYSTHYNECCQLKRDLYDLEQQLKANEIIGYHNHSFDELNAIFTLRLKTLCNLNSHWNYLFPELKNRVIKLIKKQKYGDENDALELKALQPLWNELSILSKSVKSLAQNSYNAIILITNPQLIQSLNSSRVVHFTIENLFILTPIDPLTIERPTML